MSACRCAPTVPQLNQLPGGGFLNDGSAVTVKRFAPIVPNNNNRFSVKTFSSIVWNQFVSSHIVLPPFIFCRLFLVCFWLYYNSPFANCQPFSEKKLSFSDKIFPSLYNKVWTRKTAAGGTILLYHAKALIQTAENRPESRKNPHKKTATSQPGTEPGQPMAAIS